MQNPRSAAVPKLVPALFQAVELPLVVAVHPDKPPKESRVFEQANLARLKKCSETVSRAEQLIRQAKRQIEQSKELVDSTLPEQKRPA